MNNISLYISTSSINKPSLDESLAYFEDAGFFNIELSSAHSYMPIDEIIDMLTVYKKRGFNFLIHNYFPAPREEFVLNLASDDRGILDKSKQLCRQAIDLSQEMGAPFYSVHSGFCFHAAPRDLGRPQNSLASIPRKKAYDIFKESIDELIVYARKKGIKLACENNVVADFNRTQTGQPPLLLTEPRDFDEFYADISSKDLFYLIDLGHLKVTSASLGFEIKSFLSAALPHTIAFHLSDNNTKADEHLVFGEDVWFKDVIRSNKDKTFILETRNCNQRQIASMVSLIKKLHNQKEDQ